MDRGLESHAGKALRTLGQGQMVVGLGEQRCAEGTSCRALSELVAKTYQQDTPVTCGSAPLTREGLFLALERHWFVDSRGAMGLDSRAWVLLMSWGSPCHPVVGDVAELKYRKPHGDATQVTLCRLHLPSVGRAHTASWKRSGAKESLRVWQHGAGESLSQPGPREY